jgi:hypothetical protein
MSMSMSMSKFVKFVYIVYFFSRVPIEQICPKQARSKKKRSS